MPWNESGGDPPGGGEPGTPGSDGRTWLSGAGAPDSGAGEDGDFYLDTSSSSYYGPKASGAWGSATSLVGPPGEDGDEGPAGPAPSGGTNGQFIKRVADVPAWATPTLSDLGAGTVAPVLWIGASSAVRFEYTSQSHINDYAVYRSFSHVVAAMVGGGEFKVRIGGTEEFGVSSSAVSCAGNSLSSVLNVIGVGTMGLHSAGSASQLRMLAAGSQAAGASVICNGSTAAGTPGQLELLAIATSLAHGATRDVASTAASRNMIIEVWDTDGNWTEYRCRNGTITVLRQDTEADEYVANSPGAGQIGLEVVSGVVRINNNSGSARTLCAIPRGI